jgi:serine/threonine protein kinase/Tol biopolymer transport system component
VAIKCPKCQTENSADSKYCRECATPIAQPDIQQGSFTKTLETPREPLARGMLFARRYEIIEALGAGGMGEVYRVEDKKVGQEVALKLIKSEVAANKRAIERFRQELITARMISHRNVCRMFDLGEDKGTYFITMEYVPGEDLRSFLRRSKHLSIATAVDVAKQVAEGLAEAHRLGVVHRDLKPGNVMIDREGNARIMDFGIARLVSAKGITGAGVAVGTPDYMSPEQVEGKEVDGRADIYSLGIMLFEMVTGRVPFEADTALAIGYKHKHEQPVSPKAVNPQVPDDLSGLILRCLEKEPDKRVQTADELRAELEKIEKGLPTTAHALPPPKRTTRTSREITIKFTAKKLLVPGLSIIAGLAAIILAVIFLPHRAPPQKVAPVYRQITFTGNATEPAVSPDGKFLAYADRMSAFENRLMIQDLAGGQAIEVYHGMRLGGLRWSPDGSELLFTDQTSDSTGIGYIVPRLGGKPRQNPGAYYAAWTPDGSRLLTYSDEESQFLFVNKKTGESNPVPLELPPLTTLLEFDLSPSGKFIAFTLMENQGASLWIVGADGKGPNRIFGNESWPGSPRWSPRGDAVYFQLSGQKLTECVKMPVSPDTGKPSGPLSKVLEEREVESTFSLTGDGRHMFYAQKNEVQSIWSATPEGSGQGQKVVVKRLTSGTMQNAAPSLSQDGQFVAYTSGTGETRNIYVMPAEGGPSQQITFMDASNAAPVWSPDGKEIAFYSFEGDTTKIWKVGAAGGQPHLFAKSKGMWPSWAPGREILIMAGRENNLNFIDPATEAETPLFKTLPEGNPHWPINSPDGRRALTRWYKSQSDLGLWIIPRDGSPGVLLRKGDLIPIGWSPDGKWVFAQDRVAGGLDIIVFSTESGEGRLLYKVPFDAEMGQPSGRGHTVDGKRFVTASRRIQSDVWVMENFDPEIK